MLFNVFRVLSIVIAFILSSLTLSKETGIDFGYQGLKGLPIPYDYAWFPTFPSSQNNLIYAADFFFWIIVLNFVINFVYLRNSNKDLGISKRLFTKEFFYTLVFSVILFMVSLAVYMVF